MARFDQSLLVTVLSRDRWIVIAGLFVLTGLAWAYVLAGAGTGMSVWGMSTWAFPPPVPVNPMHASWGVGYWLIMFVMWWVMMIAMMIPSAAPTVLLHARVARHAQKNEPGTRGEPVVGSGAFVAGYLAIWGAFSAVATALQWALEQAGAVDGMMMWSTAHVLTAALLIGAGVYQFSALKRVCLDHCRSPAQFLSENWQPGRRGAFFMGVRHGAFCVGCCWVLMLLLFAGGIMNVVWIAGLAVVVLLEKVLPRGDLVAMGVGTLLVLAGLLLLVSSVSA